MISTRNNRLDPSLLDRGELDRLVAALSADGHVALIDTAGQRTEIPEPLYRQILRMVTMMHEGRALILLPEDETFTTQAAANYLGMSRQHLVDLLERGEIPHHKVGSHRRISFKDLIEYERKRDRARRQALDRLSAEVDSAALYDSDYAGEK